MTKHWVVIAVAPLLTLFAPAPVSHADIYQWEYINPADPSQGKQQSATLAPDGANAIPGTNLTFRDLTMAYLIDADLSAVHDWVYNQYYVSDLTLAQRARHHLHA